MLGPLTAFAAGLIASLLTGGRLERLGEARFRRLPLFWMGIGITLALSFAPEAILEYGVPLVLGANVMTVAFTLSNRHVPGLMLVGAGIFLNALVIVLNGAMPVSTEAARQVTSYRTVATVKHEPLTDETLLPVLADRFPVVPSGQVWSIGDLILVAGIGWIGFALPRRRPSERITPRVRDSSSGVTA